MRLMLMVFVGILQVRSSLHIRLPVFDRILSGKVNRKRAARHDRNAKPDFVIIPTRRSRNSVD